MTNLTEVAHQIILKSKRPLGLHTVNNPNCIYTIYCSSVFKLMDLSIRILFINYIYSILTFTFYIHLFLLFEKDLNII